MSKTEALNISLPPTTLAQVKTNFSFQWSSRGISYLGITIPSNLSNLYTLNYLPLLTQLRKELDTWNSVPKHFFKSLRSMTINFIWHQGMSRIRHTLLTYPKIQGGVGLPDFEQGNSSLLRCYLGCWNGSPGPSQKPPLWWNKIFPNQTSGHYNGDMDRSYTFSPPPPR